MVSWRPQLLLTSIAWLAAAQLLPAAMPTQADIDRLAMPLVESGTVVGLTVGLLSGPEQRIYGYGRLSAEGKRRPDGTTVYEIGSVTKVFTTLLLADMVERGELRLDDPVQECLPASVKVPARDGRPITLVDLATQTSGLPRLPANLLPQVVLQADNPYAAYTEKELYQFLSSYNLTSTPGTQYGYSNLGMGLLGHALARRAGVSYEALVRERICRVLGMNDTRIDLGPAAARLSPGHDADGKAVPNWDLPTLAGAGALRSTAGDLLIFLRANLDAASVNPTTVSAPSASPRERLVAAMRLAHIRRHEIGGNLSIALGWHLQDKPPLWWHNGQTGGYHGYIAFAPRQKIAVVVLTNTAGGAGDALAQGLIRLLAGEKADPPPVRMPVEVAADVLDRYVGDYQVTPSFTLSVSRQASGLVVQATGQPAFRIYASSPTEFFYRVVDARITFVPDEHGEVTKLILHQNGLDLPAWKGGLLSRAASAILEALGGRKDESKPATESPPQPDR